jgi:hypothetical protein
MFVRRNAEIDLPQVIHAELSVRVAFGGGQRRNQQRRKNGDDGNDDKHLQERKGAFHN